MTDTSASQGIPEPEGSSQIIETDYEIGQDNIETQIGPFGLDIHNPVFMVSGVCIIAFVFYTLALPEQAGAAFSWMFSAVTQGFDWFFLSAANIFVLFCLLLIVLPVGSVRLGGDEATPDYTYVGWFAMLFAAGMGIGLMFYGVSEPMSHFASSLGGTAAEDGARSDWAPLGAAAGDEQAAVRLAFAATIFHWGLHPWAIYAVVALALALFSYNKGLPLTIRSAFYPILGDRVWGWPGHVIDILAVFATLFGLATSLGMGATQANAGLNELFGVPIGSTTEVILISGITAVALISVMRGLDGGVKVLSEINMGLAALLLFFVLFAGPDAGHSDWLCRLPCRLPDLSAGAIEPGGPRRYQLHAGLDLVLLGVVDQLVAVCRHVHCARQPGPYRARVYYLRAVDPVAGLRAVDVGLWWRGNPAGFAGRLHSGAGRSA